MLSIFETDFSIETEIYARLKIDFGNLTEDSFNGKLSDVVDEELADYVNNMSSEDIVYLLTEIGFDKAMTTYMLKYGAIEPGVTSRVLLLVCIKDELDKKISFERFVKFTKA
jgi:hypothetical protein